MADLADIERAMVAVAASAILGTSK